MIKFLSKQFCPKWRNLPDLNEYQQKWWFYTFQENNNPKISYMFPGTLMEANRFMVSLLPEAITLPIGNFYAVGPQNIWE